VGGLMGNMLRRGESSWLCVKFEFGFIAGHNSLMIRVLPSSFLALTVDEVSLHFLPSPNAISCIVRFHAFKLHNRLMRLPYKMSYLFSRFMISL
jgi:hypothetical protein